LNHPNICTIYDIGEHDGQAFIAMECLEGTTLSQRIASGPLDTKTLLTVSMDVLDALDTAHAAGIVHRDVKPANLFLTARGSTKVLDFGVAKVRAVGATASALTATATAAHGVTAFGSAVGTLSYMSPEQVRGEEVDGRSDLFSFGVALYEMATGTRPFRGETTTLLLDGILNRDPAPASRLNSSLTPEFDRILLRCLAKGRDLRYQRASEVRTDLQRLMAYGDSPAGGKAVWPAALRWVAAALTLALAATPASVFYRRTPPLTDRDTIVLADFENATGDEVFDGVLRQGLAVQLRQSRAQTYPRDPNPPGLMAGFASIGTGQFESALEYGTRSLALDPDLAPAYATQALHNLYLGRLAEAEAVVRRALERKLEFPDFFLVSYFTAFLRGDTERMKQAVAKARGKRGVEDWIAFAEALAAARAGRLHEARRLARLAADLAEQTDQRERAATFEAGAAVWEGFFGNTDEARGRASKALSMSTGRDVQYAAAFALVLAGESPRAETLADDLEKRFPEDTCVRFSYLPPLRALLN
jgi:tetratricopeptide (TPR) repeat protein